MSITGLSNLDEASVRSTDGPACEACAFGAEYHRWPTTAGTHCRGCHRSWTSTKQAHCTVCCGQFAGNKVADLHWREPKGQDPVHLDPSTISRLELHDEKMGPVWRSTGNREARRFVTYAERGAFSAPEYPDGVPSTWEGSRQVVGAG